jgi:esterase/lipase
MKKKVLYLHGLESSNTGSKIEFLHEQSDLLAPLINYRDYDLEQNLMGMVESFQPDVIIGSSMGGYTALNLGNYFNIPVIAFNPAIHSRSFEPAFRKLVKQDPCFNFTPVIVLGLEDNIIDSKKTVEILEGADFTVQYELYPEMKHRIPFEVFVDIYNKYVNNAIQS